MYVCVGMHVESKFLQVTHDHMCAGSCDMFVPHRRQCSAASASLRGAGRSRSFHLGKSR